MMNKGDFTTKSNVEQIWRRHVATTSKAHAFTSKAMILDLHCLLKDAVQRGKPKKERDKIQSWKLGTKALGG